MYGQAKVCRSTSLFCVLGHSGRTGCLFRHVNRVLFYVINLRNVFGQGGTPRGQGGNVGSYYVANFYVLYRTTKGYGREFLGFSNGLYGTSEHFPRSNLAVRATFSNSSGVYVFCVIKGVYFFRGSICAKFRDNVRGNRGDGPGATNDPNSYVHKVHFQGTFSNRYNVKKGPLVRLLGRNEVYTFLEARGNTTSLQATRQVYRVANGPGHAFFRFQRHVKI